jgi:AcrR family transcriptional regulator
MSNKPRNLVVGMAEEETGRYRQRRRTRTAIVAAAGRLLQSGVTPSMSDIAEAADVSRRTVYLYFPTLEQLLIDATLGALSQSTMDEAIETADTSGGDADARVAAMLDVITSQSAQTLPLGRSLIRLTVEEPPSPAGPAVPRRGYRRMAWLEKAIEPLKPRLEPGQYQRLLSGLAMVIGWEASIVLTDLRGLPLDEQRETSLWAARALIAAALDPGMALDPGAEVPSDAGGR